MELSCYLLTYDSEQRLEEVLQSVSQFADEIVALDSGSSDGTEAICEKYHCKFLTRQFDNFINQRNAAIDDCSHNWVFGIDSDEVADDELIAALKDFKSNNATWNNQTFDAYQIQRRWFVAGKEIHVILPINCPDAPVRLFRKDKVRYDYDASKSVHEAAGGYDSLGYIDRGYLLHYSFDEFGELFDKADHYTDLAAQDMIRKKKKLYFFNLFLNPIGAWIKWYLRKGGWRDGWVGAVLGYHAYRYTYLKYKKALAMRK